MPHSAKFLYRDGRRAERVVLYICRDSLRILESNAILGFLEKCVGPGPERALTPRSERSRPGDFRPAKPAEDQLTH